MGENAEMAEAISNVMKWVLKFTSFLQLIQLVQSQDYFVKFEKYTRKFSLKPPILGIQFNLKKNEIKKGLDYKIQGSSVNPNGLSKSDDFLPIF